MRIVGRDEARDFELRVERRARHPLQPRHELAAVGERREEREVQSVRQAEHIGHEPVVIVDAHLEFARPSSTQTARAPPASPRGLRRRRTRRGVPTAAACRVRTSDGSKSPCSRRQRVARSPSRSGLLSEPISMIEPLGLRSPAREHDPARDLHRRRDDDEILIESGCSSQSATRGNGLGASLGSAISTAKPCEPGTARTTRPSCRRRR